MSYFNDVISIGVRTPSYHLPWIRSLSFPSSLKDVLRYNISLSLYSDSTGPVRKIVLLPTLPIVFSIHKILLLRHRVSTSQVSLEPRKSLRIHVWRPIRSSYPLHYNTITSSPDLGPPSPDSGGLHVYSRTPVTPRYLLKTTPL